MIKKAVLPVAGKGTRFLPATKEIAKEIIPVIDKPLIHYSVEEAIESNINDFVFITSREKSELQDYFTPNYELELFLKDKGKSHLLEEFKKFYELNFTYIRQNYAKGFGHAILLSEKAIGNNPFAVLLPDDLIIAKTPVIKQMIDVYNKYKCSLIAFMKVDEKEVSRYGIAAGKMIEENLFEIEELIEKPKKEDAPSNYAVIGRYILTPEIFEILKHSKPGAGGEIQLTDAIRELMKTQKVLGYFFEGKRYDAGTPAGFIEAFINIALNRDDTREQTLKVIKEIIKNENL